MLDIHTDRDATYLYFRVTEKWARRIRTVFYLLVAAAMFALMVYLLYTFPDPVIHEDQTVYIFRVR